MVAFANREESQKTLALAIQLAAATQAHITVVKVLANPQSVGVVAELIATDEPFIMANDEVQSAVEELMREDIAVSSVVRTADEVGKGIVATAIELGVDMVFLGTRDISKPSDWLMENDPIAHYVVNHCPANIVLVRNSD